MQPQGQDTPTPNSTPQDTSPPQAPQTPPANPPTFGAPAANPAPTPEAAPPQAGPSFAAPQHGVMPNTPAGQPKKAPIALIAIIAGAIVLIGGGVFAYFMFFKGIALEQYNADQYSMQIPAGYTKEDQGDGVVFTEPGAKATASSVFAYYAEFPGNPTQAQIETAKTAFKSQLESKIGTYTSSTHEISDVKIEDTTFKGSDAIKVSAKAKSDSSEGVVKMIAVIDTEKIYIVGVAADGGDGGLIAKADEIINSFTVK